MLSIRLTALCLGVWMSFVVGLMSVRADSRPPSVPAVSPNLEALYEAGRWAELREALVRGKAPALYRGASAVVFNEDPGRAERLLWAAVAAAPSAESAYQAYEWLIHLYLYTGQYRRLVAALERRWASFPGRPESADERAMAAGFRGLPDQTVELGRASVLRTEPGSIFIPVAIDGGAASYFFDTGAWLSCMSESEAKRLGLTVREVGGSLGTSTGAQVGFRTAVVERLRVGNTRFRNVSFAVFPDDQEPWSRLSPGRRGLLGISVLRGLRTLRWSSGGRVEVCFATRPFDVRRSNIYFDNDHLVLRARFREREILATLDTGAETTDLYAQFAREFATVLSAEGTESSTEVRGVGQSERFESITVPELRFRVGGADTALRPANVLLGREGAKGCVGNFGMDVVGQARAFTIDFGAMTLDIGERRGR